MEPDYRDMMVTRAFARSTSRQVLLGRSRWRIGSHERDCDEVQGGNGGVDRQTGPRGFVGDSERKRVSDPGNRCNDKSVPPKPLAHRRHQQMRPPGRILPHGQARESYRDEKDAVHLEGNRFLVVASDERGAKGKDGEGQQVEDVEPDQHAVGAPD
jgi:hypothetical protein